MNSFYFQAVGLGIYFLIIICSSFGEESKKQKIRRIERELTEATAKGYHKEADRLTQQLIINKSK